MPELEPIEALPYGAVTKTTLSRANETRDWRIFADFAMGLIAEARRLYGTDSQLEIDLKGSVFAIDSTIIDLCLNVYAWAHFRKAKAAAKLHVQLDLKNSIPCFIHITTGKVHDLNVLDLIDFEPDGFLRHGSRIRAHRNFDFKRRIYSHTADKASGLLCDQTVRLASFYPSKRYPAPLRRIKFHDTEHDRILVFLTNNFDLKATEVAQLYKHRWHIELFFKWIKQHLKIKSFWGYSANAVKTQIWTAIAVYTIVAIVKRNSIYRFRSTKSYRS